MKKKTLLGLLVAMLFVITPAALIAQDTLGPKKDSVLVRPEEDGVFDMLSELKRERVTKLTTHRVNTQTIETARKTRVFVCFDQNLELQFPEVPKNLIEAKKNLVIKGVTSDTYANGFHLNGIMDAGELIPVKLDTNSYIYRVKVEDERTVDIPCSRIGKKKKQFFSITGKPGTSNDQDVYQVKVIVFDKGADPTKDIGVERLAYLRPELTEHPGMIVFRLNKKE